MVVEYEERQLPPISVPATLNGVRYALTNLRYAGQGEEYSFLDGHNGSNFTLLVYDATGRQWRIKSGQAIELDLLSDSSPTAVGVTYIAIEPSGGDVAAGEVVLQPTVRWPRRG